MNIILDYLKTTYFVVTGLRPARAIIIIFLCNLLFFTSCGDSHNGELLRKAMSVVETDPELSLAYLDSIEYPENTLSNEQYRQYVITDVQAKYKTFRDIKDEKRIFEVQSYYNRDGNNPEMTALANLYSGCVHEENGENDAAMNDYNLAFNAAKIVNDSLIMARILLYKGGLLSKQGLYLESIKKYEEAAALCSSYADKKASCYLAIGNRFLPLNNYDSAFYYYDEGLELARNSGDSSLYGKFLHNIGLTYLETNNYDTAAKYLREAREFVRDTAQSVKFHLTFASLYLSMNCKDSINHYGGLLCGDIDKVDDDLLLVNIYDVLSNIALYNNRYDSAYYYVKKYSEKVVDITEDRLSQSVYEIQQKYDYEKIRNEYQAKQIRSQRIGLLLLFFLIISLFVMLFFSIRLSNKRKEALVANERLRDSEIDKAKLMGQKDSDEKTISMLENRISQLDRKNTDSLQKYWDEINSLKNEIAKNNSDMDRCIDLLRNASNWQISFVNNLLTIVNYRQDAGTIVSRIKSDLLTDTPFNVIMEIFNNEYPGLAIQIKNRYPDLTETEFKVCILSFSQLSSKDMSNILGQSTNSINSARSNIRSKINIEMTGGDISKHILTELFNK